jgi:uroporphyrinogen decarboxylase
MTVKQEDYLLIRAAFKQAVERTPVWVMRQAGRYLPEYLEVRKKAGSLLNLFTNPELAAEVSIQPLDLMEVDAVIMFSDILTPLMGMGIGLDFAPGPVIKNPVRSEGDIQNLLIPDPDELTPYVGKILSILKKELSNRAPIIGFAGAPFTLASYLIEGGSSKLFHRLTQFFLESPTLAHKLMAKLTKMTISYLNYQIENGAQMVQLFDTWAGIFSEDDFKEFIFPYVRQIFSELTGKGKVPGVYYVNGGCHLLNSMSNIGADVIGLDWRADIGEVRKQIGDKVALQGNLDPNVLFCQPEVIKQRVQSILSKYGPESGHIFNLGHGIDKEVNPEHLLFMVRTVKELSVR